MNYRYLDNRGCTTNMDVGHLFSTLPDVYTGVWQHADFIVSHIDNLVNVSAEQDNMLSSLLTYSNLPIYFDMITNPLGYLGHLSNFVKAKPKYLDNRVWAILHYTDTEYLVLPNWVDSSNLIYWDMRLDHFRMFIMGSSSLRSNWEYSSLLRSKVNIYKTDLRLRKFLVANRIKPKNHMLGGRFYLDQACKGVEHMMWRSSQDHAICGGFGHDHDLWYGNQGNDFRLQGCLEDPLIDNFKRYNPVDNSLAEIKRISEHDVNNFPHSYYFEQSYCSVYTETNEAHDPLPSEKTWYPLSQGHLILPLAGRGLINLLKKLNFKFPNFINYSYDLEADDEIRRRMWLNEFKRLQDMDINEFHILYMDNLDLTIHNIKNFYHVPYKDPFRTLVRLHSSR